MHWWFPARKFFWWSSRKVVTNPRKKSENPLVDHHLHDFGKSSTVFNHQNSYSKSIIYIHNNDSIRLIFRIKWVVFHISQINEHRAWCPSFAGRTEPMPSLAVDLCTLTSVAKRFPRLLSLDWLVVDLPLWKIWKSVGMIIPNIWKNKGHVPNHQPDWIGWRENRRRKPWFLPWNNEGGPVNCPNQSNDLRCVVPWFYHDDPIMTADMS
jgi:hypothetical protein